MTFENPCLTEIEREKGLQIAKTKSFSPPFTCCFVGRLEDAKGVQRIIDAFGLLHNLENIATIHFIGNGEKMDHYKKQCTALGIPAVFHGFLERKQVFEIYKKAHFILLPSDSEGFPKVIAEAMNFGCIPIVSDISSIGQYINTNTGFLLNPINSEKIEELVRKATSKSTEELTNMAFNSYLVVSKFTFENYRQKIQEEIMRL